MPDGSGRSDLIFTKIIFLFFPDFPESFDVNSHEGDCDPQGNQTDEYTPEDTQALLPEDEQENTGLDHQVDDHNNHNDGGSDSFFHVDYSLVLIFTVEGFRPAALALIIRSPGSFPA